MTETAETRRTPRVVVAWAVSGWILAVFLAAVLISRSGDGMKAPPMTVVSEPVDSEVDTPTPTLVEESRDPLEHVHAAMFAAHLEAATERIQAADYEGAIESYDQALEIEPQNTSVLLLRAQAAMLRALEVAKLEIHQSRTEVVPDSASAPVGFEPGNVTVSSGTQTGDHSAQLILDLLPKSPRPGDPYVLRVRVYNIQNRSIRVQAIEIVSTFGAKSVGRGQKLAPVVSLVQPKAVAILWEVQGTWTEQQAKGSIEVTVTLVDDTKLSKTIWW